jgi:hypothetical protein
VLGQTCLRWGVEGTDGGKLPSITTLPFVTHISAPCRNCWLQKVAFLEFCANHKNGQSLTARDHRWLTSVWPSTGLPVARLPPVLGMADPAAMLAVCQPQHSHLEVAAVQWHPFSIASQLRCCHRDDIRSAHHCCGPTAALARRFHGCPERGSSPATGSTKRPTRVWCMACYCKCTPVRGWQSCH